MSRKQLTAVEVSAMHALDHFFEEDCVGCVAWAASELVAGRDSPGLRVLAGEGPPFNKFEMASLVDRTLDELEVARFACAKEAALALTFELVRQIAAGESDPGAGLSRIHRFYYEPYAPVGLEGLVNLGWAHHDLVVEGEYHSWYRTDCTPETIDVVILGECLRWMEEHLHDSDGKARSG